MALNEAYRNNFNTLQQAFENGDVCLMECTDKQTGEMVPTICAVELHGDEYVMVPFAKLFTGNPYEELDPPGE